LALRPRLKAAVPALLKACEGYGVRLEMLPGGAPAAAQATGGRAGVAVTAADDVSLIRQRQGTGAVVAFVADSGEAGPAFAACDLAVGLGGGYVPRHP
jgi:cation transport ATPase